MSFHEASATFAERKATLRQISLGKQNRTFILVLSPVVQIPAELEKVFVVLDHDVSANSFSTTP